MEYRAVGDLEDRNGDADSSDTSAGGATDSFAGRTSSAAGASGKSGCAVGNDGATLVTGGASASSTEAGGASVSDCAPLRVRLEAEDAILSDGAVRRAATDAAGGYYADMGAKGTITFHVSVPQSGTYALTIVSAVPAGWGAKSNELFANGSAQGSVLTDDRSGTGSFYAQSGLWVDLDAGENTLSIEPSWGYVRVDYLEVDDAVPDRRPFDSAPVTPNASSATRQLLAYLTGSHGRRILSGQQGMDYVAKVKALTGKEPAVVGFDMVDYSPSRLDFMAARDYGETERAIAWWRDRKGIVTFCWHWNAPTGLINRKYVDEQGTTVDASWYRGFYTNATTFDLAAALDDPTSPEYLAILRDIDAIAEQLKKLAAAAVPVLWRPLHEASGGWFWWGARGAAPYIELYRLLYDRLTNFHHLDNLLWVQNGQHPDWYPGDDVVDIVAEDIYGAKLDYSPRAARYSQASRYSTNRKLVTLSEAGALVDPAELGASLAQWSWFALWSGDEYVVTEEWNTDVMKRAVYASEYVVTLDELPDLTKPPP